MSSLGAGLVVDGAVADGVGEDVDCVWEHHEQLWVDTQDAAGTVGVVAEHLASESGEGGERRVAHSDELDVTGPALRPPKGRQAALATAGNRTTLVGRVAAFAFWVGAFVLWGAIKAGAPGAWYGLLFGVPFSALLSAMTVTLRVGVGPDWFAKRSLGRTDWVDLPTLQEAQIYRPRRGGGGRLRLRDAAGRRVNVDMLLVVRPEVLDALRAGLPDHAAAGFDDMSQALLGARRRH